MTRQQPEPGPAAGRRTGRRRREATQRRLMDAALDLFVERGLRDTPIELICERAGFTRGAFYSNFSSKEELFLALFREQYEQRLARLERLLEDNLAGPLPEQGLSVHEVIGEIAALFLREYVADANWHLVATEFRTSGLRLPGLRARIDAELTRFYERLGLALVTRVDRLGIALTVDPVEAGEVLTAMYEMLLERALRSGAPPAPDDRFLAHVLPSVIGAFLVVPADEGEGSGGARPPAATL